MKKYKVNYKTNRAPVAGKTVTVLMEGTNVDDVKARFERTSTILAGGDPTYEAEIITISEIASESQLKRYAAQGVPGA